MAKWSYSPISTKMKEAVEFYKELYRKYSHESTKQELEKRLKTIRFRVLIESFSTKASFTSGNTTTFQIIERDYSMISLNVQTYPMCCGIAIISNFSPDNILDDFSEKETKELYLKFFQGVLANLSNFVGHVGLLEAVTVDNTGQTKVWEFIFKKVGFKKDRTFYNCNSGNNLTIWHGVTIHDNNERGVEIGINSDNDEEYDDHDW